MVEPVFFGSNSQTTDNSFQGKSELPVVVARKLAVQEFACMVDLLRGSGVDVLQLKPPRNCPDAVYPNNWFSYHSATGLLVTYPMFAPNRRAERQPAKLVRVLQEAGCPVQRKLNLSMFEDSHMYLEGTGSLVFDDENRKVFAALSERTHPELVERVAQFMGYQAVMFETSHCGVPVYHTNVMLSIGLRHAIVCLECVTSGKANLERSLPKSRIIISRDQMDSFCGNVLFLNDILLMSQTALDSFGQSVHLFESDGYRIVAPAIPTIEQVGGGSARCMVATVS